MFVDRGYAGTSLRAVADAAGVSVPTVEQTFRTKANLLKTVVDVARAGDDEPVPVLDRLPARQALSARDLGGFLDAICAEIGAVAARVTGILTVVDQAAASDDRIARLAAEVDAQRRAVAGWILDGVRRHAPLRDGLTETVALDTIWVLMDPAVHRRLLVDRGWSPADLAAWLSDAIVALLTTRRRRASRR
jgi:TetR/AcrR family transcriptional regulator, regulator of autoinduction and epiphytic fitness